MEAKLVVVVGETQPRQYALQLPTVIGRSRSTDVTLGHPLVSRQHCEVFESNGMLMVRDLGSLNGTFVGDKRIAEQAMPVKPGDLLTIGPVTFQAVYQAGGARGPGDSTWRASGPTVDAPLPGRADDRDAIDELKDTPGPPRDADGKNPGDGDPPGRI